MFFRRLILITSLQILMFSLSLALESQAQIVPNSGNILQDLQKKTVPSDLQPDTLRQKPPETPIEDNQEQIGPGRGGDGFIERKVFIQDIEIKDMTFLSQEDVQKVLAEYKNKDNSFSDVQTLTVKLTNLYREKGYMTSRVYVPPQRLHAGTLYLQALEGHVGQISVKPGRYYKARSVTPYVSIKPGDAFNVNALKQNLRIINDNPDRIVRTSLNAGEDTGETDIELVITDRRPVHITPSWGNLGRHLIGDNQAGLKFVNNNILGFGDSLLSSVSFTRRSFGLVNHYQAPIGHRGTKIGFDHAASTLQLGENFSSLDVRGSSSTYSPFIFQDLINHERSKLYADIAFDFKQMDTNILGSDFSHDQLRTLRSGLSYEEYDKWGRTYFHNEIGWGLGIFGGTSGFQPLASRVGGGSKFFRYTSSLVRTQTLPFNTYGVFRIMGQLSPDRLVSAEQFQAGGAFTVRGYKEGQVSGDNGLLFSGEWRMPFFLTPKGWAFPGTKYVPRENIQIISFADYGSIFVNKPAAGVDKNEHVLGAGFGLRVKLTQYLVGRLDIAFPLLNQPGDDSGARLHFGLQSDIL